MKRVESVIYFNPMAQNLSLQVRSKVRIGAYQNALTVSDPTVQILPWKWSGWWISYRTRNALTNSNPTVGKADFVDQGHSLK